MEQLYMLIHEETKEKQAGSHRVAAEIVAGMICGSKYWTLEMVSQICSLYVIIEFESSKKASIRFFPN
ncbi:unnamed protein product [Rotaria sp. Silwood2]|nr:unnamed protein product [Rotaria sp. Silwood2]CAF4317603.1 unnamed protein product [Rotaria sp. Silwood2]